MIRIAICDNERIALDSIQDHVSRAFNGQELEIERFESGAALRARIVEGAGFDLLFLDINMPDINGIFLAKHIKPLIGECLLIFVSSQEDAVFESFSASPFRFLRKSRMEEEMPQIARDILLALREKPSQSIVLKYRQSFLRLNPYRVLYLESNGKVQTIHLIDRSVEVNYRLKELEEMFRPFGFLKPHNSYLVNCRFISSIRQTDIYMDNGERLPVSKHRLKEVKQFYLAYISQT